MYEFNFVMNVIDTFAREIEITGSVIAMNECEALNIVEDRVMSSYPYDEIILLNVECIRGLEDFTICTVETIG